MIPDLSILGYFWRLGTFKGFGGCRWQGVGNLLMAYIYCQTMKQIVIILLLACLLATSQQATFCSVACSTACQGELSTQCGTQSTNCQGDGAWVNTPSGSCAVKPTWVYYNSTSDYNSGTLINTATLGDSCNDMRFYGYMTPSTPIKINANGIQKPHYRVRIYVGIIAVDFDCKWGKGACGTTQNYWDSKAAYFEMTFNDPLGTETVNPTYYRALTNNREHLCGAERFGQYWTRISKLYTTYNDSSPLQWTFRLNEANSSAKWGIREFIILYQACHIACFSCYGGSSSQCYTCYNVASDPAATTNYWQNNNTCNETCLTSFGYSTTPYVCIYCDLRCTACYNMADNCTACTVSGTWAAFLYTADPTYPTCVNPCPDGFFANKVTRTCDPCNQTCATCLNSATYCTSCVWGYYWSNWFCYNPCPIGYFLDVNGLNCTKCSPFCIECYTTNVTCTSCTLSGQFKAYLTNTSGLTGTCDPLCLPGNYQESFGGVGPNLCLNCSSNCTYCTGYPSPCSHCATGFYLLGTQCLDSCPVGYIIRNNSAGSGVCLNCDIVCVGLTINMYFPSVTNDKIHVDMMYSQDIDFTIFPWQTFQNITITSKNIAYTLDMFTVTYSLLNTRSYRITIEPKTYIFLYNATFTIMTGPQPAVLDTSIALMPFKTSNYLKTAALTWFLIKGPPFNALETGIMNSFAKLSSNMNTFLTKPFVQQFKKSGVFNLLFSGSSITSCSMLSNQIQSQNLYEGVRVFATFVFFDAPPYEQISDKTKRFIAPTVEDKIRNAQEVAVEEYKEEKSSKRLLFSTDTMYWRFQRTGQTSFFIYDVYVPMFLLGLCWIALLVAHNSKGERWFASYGPHLYSAVHKIHEMSLMYITMASIVEFIYFEPTSADRFISAIVCIIFSVYFAAYELYIYYDMIKYPLAEIGNKAYDYYVLRYGCFLKNVRYEEYDMNEHWSPRHWLRPYNYHLLSYYKKFVMMISLPLFYSVVYSQMGILLFLQIIELFRFWMTWPFASDKRNYLRMTLQFALAVFFLVNLIQIKYLELIMSADPADLEHLTKIFYALGWTGFAMCLYFNISFISINVYDLCVGLKVSSRAKMDEARKRYYYRKIREYEKDNEASSKELVGRWVRLGNLNNKSYGELPEVNVRIEYYEIRKVGSKYEVSIKKITSLLMKNKAKLRKANQTTAGGKIQRKLILGPADHSRLYSIIHDVYRRFEGPHVETLRIKTFLNVWQQKYSDGQEITLNRDMMFQRAELISYDNDVNKQKLEALMEDFPIDETIINNAV